MNGKNKHTKQMIKLILMHHINRYNLDKQLLEKHPELEKILTESIKNHEKAIINCVTSKDFQAVLESCIFI